MDNINDLSKDVNFGKSETISELARRHMTDENHTTSDAEIRNAKVEFSENVHEDPALEELFEVDNETVFPSFSNEEDSPKKDKDEPEHDSDSQAKTSPPNPYNVLGS